MDGRRPNRFTPKKKSKLQKKFIRYVAAEELSRKIIILNYLHSEHLKVWACIFDQVF